MSSRRRSTRWIWTGARSASSVDGRIAISFEPDHPAAVVPKPFVLRVDGELVSRHVSMVSAKLWGGRFAIRLVEASARGDR